MFENHRTLRKKNFMTLVLALIFSYDIKSKGNKSRNKQDYKNYRKLQHNKGIIQENKKATQALGENICELYLIKSEYPKYRRKVITHQQKKKKNR
jgi:hypothetical protein